MQCGPEGPLAPPTRRPGRHSAKAPRRPAKDAGRLARKAKTGAAETRGSHGAAADLTRGPLAAAPSGLCGRPGRPPDRGQAYSRRPRVKSAARLTQSPRRALAPPTPVKSVLTLLGEFSFSTTKIVVEAIRCSSS